MTSRKGRTKLGEISEEGRTLSFETEAVENAPPGTKARFVFLIKAEGELEQSFYVAFPGREWGCVSTNFLRKKGG